MNSYKLANLLLTKFNYLSISGQFVRERHTKHWNPKWKKLRKEKVIKVDLKEFVRDEKEEMSEDEKRSKMKAKGIFPQKQWHEQPIYLSCTGEVFEPYVPPEGDGKFSLITTSGAKQNVELLTKKTKSWREIRKIKRYEEYFEVHEFADSATDIYINAHKTLAKKDMDNLTLYITEKLYPEMTWNLENKIISWKFIQSLEPARVVHIRTTSLITENNIFAQVTVRFHTQQILALYDRFGRLMSGSEILAKDVLEYIVFEKHLSNEYGSWRLHSKIIPQWMPARPAAEKTFVIKSE